jgi:hypothetical protein
MDPDKEIINWWLNKQGFFTISGIKVDKNRVIDLIAIKLVDGKATRIMHIETAVSVSNIDAAKIKGYVERFEDASINAKVKETIKNYIGDFTSYEKVFIVGQDTSSLNMKSITVFSFNDMLLEIMKSLDKQNYFNPVIRTLQLLKYQFMSDPVKLAELVNVQGDPQIFSGFARDIFMKELLQHGATKKALSKPELEAELIDVLRLSSINRPEKLARILQEQVLGSKSKKKFMRSMEPEKKIKEIHVKENNNQQLLEFFS